MLGAGIVVISVMMGLGNLTRPFLSCLLRALRSLGRIQMQQTIFCVVSRMSVYTHLQQLRAVVVWRRVLARPCRCTSDRNSELVGLLEAP